MAGQQSSSNSLLLEEREQVHVDHVLEEFEKFQEEVALKLNN
jgi:hypothetical protein